MAEYYPALRLRPHNQQGADAFGGLMHRPTAAFGSWYDERNLSAELAPTLSVRRARAQAENIDGNSPDCGIVAVCGGDHICLLDEKGYLYCNGHKALMVGTEGDAIWWMHWEAQGKNPDGSSLEITPATGNQYVSTFEEEIMTPMWERSYSHRERLRFTQSGSFADYDCRRETETGEWVLTPCELILDLEAQETYWWLEEYKLRVTGVSTGAELWIDASIVNPRMEQPPKLIRMGARVIEPYSKSWANAVKLSAGEELVIGEDRGSLEMVGGGSSQSFAVILSLCDIDGNAFSGVAVSSTEPASGTKYWLDKSGVTPVLRQRQAGSWMVISSTYVKVENVYLRDPYNVALKRWDTMHFEYFGNEIQVILKPGDRGEANEKATKDAVKALLDSAHYVYNLVEEDAAEHSGYIVIAGMLPFTEFTLRTNFQFRRTVPDMDYVVEAGNRLWGCRYDEAEGLNEIYGSKLGDPGNWEVFQGLSTDSWRASRGTAAPFTGAAALDGYPLFFREDSMEKIYPSASGAHQIQSFGMEGVQEGSADSLVVIEDRLYYKSRQGIMVYAGTMPQRISEAFGGWQFGRASGARHGRRYCVAMDGPTGDGGRSVSAPTGNGGLGSGHPTEGRVCAVYDLETGVWHLEDEAWEGKAVTWKDQLYYIREGQVIRMEGDSRDGVNWWAESAPQGIVYPEHKWISYIRFRLRLDPGAELRIWISYDDGDWIEVARAEGTYLEHPNRLGPAEINFTPRRCDHFRLRIGGTGGCQIYSITWRQEQSEGRR